jgi:NAD(P)H-dependent flavin oxidoreductase YrpB (nitropropane dioxygenase family)
MITTPMTELAGCTAPIQLAGMGPVCSDELCAAVSEAGGLGMITVAATPPPALEARLGHIRSLTPKPTGANFLIPALDRDSLLLAGRSVRVIDFFWGDPDPELVERASYAEIPPRVEYRLTPAGRTLEPVLAALSDPGPHRARRNRPCPARLTDLAAPQRA